MKRKNRFYILFYILFCVSFLNAQNVQEKYTKKNINWNSTLKKALELSSKNKKPILLFITQKHCKFCKNMEKNVFSKTNIINKINSYYIPLKLDIKKSKKYFTFVTPAFFFLDSKGDILFSKIGPTGIRQFDIYLDINH